MRNFEKDQFIYCNGSDIEKPISDLVLPNFSEHLELNLTESDITLNVQIYKQGTFCSIISYDGLKGLPISSQGKGMCLISGGIDSPVAAW